MLSPPANRASAERHLPKPKSRAPAQASPRPDAKPRGLFAIRLRMLAWRWVIHERSDRIKVETRENPKPEGRNPKEFRIPKPEMHFRPNRRQTIQSARFFY